MNRSECKIGISTSIDYSVRIEDQIRHIHKAGFHFISVGADTVHSRFFDKRDFTGILKLVSRESLFVESAHIPFGPGYNISDKDKSDRRKAVNNTMEFLKHTADYGIPLAIIHPHHYLQESREEVFKKSLESLKTIIESKPKEIRMAVENLPTADGNWICSNLLNNLDKSKIGFCYDSSHENMSGRSFEILRKYHERITTTHLSDNHGQSDEHLIPGEGNIDWKRLIYYLDLSNELKNLLFEIGTGEKLAAPLPVFLRKALRGIEKSLGGDYVRS